MRTNNCKNEKKQNASQANNRLPASSIKPVFKKNKEVVIKANLLHLDGTESEIVMMGPGCTLALEAYEDAGRMMAEYVSGLTCYWVQIERFQVQVGVMRDGQFEPTLLGNPEQIPLNMIFEPGISGKWITQADAMSKRYVNDSFKRGGAPC